MRARYLPFPQVMQVELLEHVAQSAMLTHDVHSLPVFDVCVHLFFTPAASHGSGAHVAQGAFPDADQVEPAIHATWHTVSVVLEQDVLTPTAPHVDAAAQVSHGALPDREKVEPATHAMWQTVSVVLVQAVFTPGAHVESAAQVSHGALPEEENVVPAAHATWHTVSVVLEQAVFTPVGHVASAAQVLHGALPESEKVLPAAHATWHTVSVVVEQTVFTPDRHVASAAQILHGAVPAVEKVDPATQGAGFLQQVASLGLVAPDLLLSYTRDPVHDASANALPPLVVSPHVGTKADVMNEAEATVLGVVMPLL